MIFSYQVQQNFAIRNPNGKYVSFVKGKRFSLCDFFKKPKIDYALNIMLTRSKKFSNNTFSCPFTTVEYLYQFILFDSFNFFQNNYNTIGIYMEDGLLPKFIPPGSYIAEVIWSLKVNTTFLDYFNLKIFSKINSL